MKFLTQIVFLLLILFSTTISKSFVYFSLTTSPGRLNYLHSSLNKEGKKGLLDSINKCFSENKLPNLYDYRVSINAPLKYRNKFEYKGIEELRNVLISLNRDAKGLKVEYSITRPKEDVGPITKMLPTIQRIKKESQTEEVIVISIDDDHTYNCDFLEKLIEKQFEAIANNTQLPTPIFSGGGAKISHWYLNDLDYPNKVKDVVETDGQREVENIEGFASVAYPVKHISENEIKLMALLANTEKTNVSCRLSDDLVISFVMKLGGRKLINLTDGYNGNKKLDHVDEINPISGDLESNNDNNTDPKESFKKEWQETFKESVKNLINIEKGREKLKQRDCKRRIEKMGEEKKELSDLLKSLVDFVIEFKVEYEIKNENKTKKLNKAEKDSIKDKTLESYGLSGRYIEDPSEALTVLTNFFSDTNSIYKLKDSSLGDTNKVFKYLTEKFQSNKKSYINLVRNWETDQKNLINITGKIDLLKSVMKYVRNNETKNFMKANSQNFDIVKELKRFKNKVRFEEVKYRVCLKKILEEAKDENGQFLSIENFIKKLNEKQRRKFLKSL